MRSLSACLWTKIKQQNAKFLHESYILGFSETIYTC